MEQGQPFPERLVGLSGTDEEVHWVARAGRIWIGGRQRWGGLKDTFGANLNSAVLNAGHKKFQLFYLFSPKTCRSCVL